MSQRRIVTSAVTWTALAFVLWVVSLFLPGFVVEHRDALEPWSGVRILFWGWLGPLNGSLAWYANPLFLFATVRLLAMEPPERAPMLLLVVALGAAGLALSAFGFSSMLADAGGGRSPVYGYGTGMLVWITATLCTVCAVGCRVAEASRVQIGLGWSGVLVVCLGVAGIAVVWMHSGFDAVRDRESATQAERDKLAKVVSKRGATCDVEPVRIAAALRLDGPLELELEKARMTPAQFLSWGIPRVRHAGLDYSVRVVGGEALTIGELSSGPADAVYTQSGAFDNYRAAVRTRLYSRSQDKVYFDLLSRQVGRHRYPDQDMYDLLPLALASGGDLGSGDGRDPRTARILARDKEQQPAVIGENIESARVGPYLIMDHAKPPPSGALNCPVSISVRHAIDGVPFRKYIQLGELRVQLRSSLFSDGWEGGFLCTPEGLYEYSSKLDAGAATKAPGSAFVVSLVLRSPDDYARRWRGVVRVPLAGDTRLPPHVIGVARNGAEMRIDLAGSDGAMGAIRAVFD